MAKGLGHIQRKILKVLLGGASLAFASPSPKQFFKTLRSIDREFARVKQRQLADSIRAIHETKLVDFRERADGTIDMVLLEKGKNVARVYEADDLRIPKPLRWDKKWRVVTFDIPYTLKKTRDAFRFHLKRLGFHQFQKSIFVFPYPCERELDFLIEIHNLRPFVRFLIATYIDSELQVRKHFDLL